MAGHSPASVVAAVIPGWVRRGVLLTPFHTMALMGPKTTPDDVARHHETFAAALGELLG